MTFHCDFRVRYYECDAYGHANNATYARYFQEAAFDASAALGYTLDWYEEHGYVWLVRDTRIRYHRPAAYGQTLTASTWVDGFSRVRSERRYELHRDDALVADGLSEWAFLERDTLRPTAIPEEVHCDFLPPGKANHMERSRFPKQPPLPAEPVIVHRRVEWADVDPMGHANNAVYFTYTEEAAVQAVAHFGYPMYELIEQGIAFFAMEKRIAYDQPALPGDLLRITTYLSDYKRVGGTRHFLLERESDGARIARAYTRWAVVNPQTGKPRRLDPAIEADVQEHISHG
ncbi:MAG: hypothetical protein GYB64_18495 [Chloroflexi bacterium]|nr:hypothetical protein [Chloroflexota bacterium]